jgi:excisionase family DNA binding protein
MLREAIAADRAERSEPADAVFNTNQAAKILNISAERLRRLCRAEQITFHLHRGRYSFRQSDLDEYREVYRHPRRSVFRR